MIGKPQLKRQDKISFAPIAEYRHENCGLAGPWQLSSYSRQSVISPA
jgi:hypothetical protein